MSKRDRRLLERLHGMLGSSNASEAESARQRLLELLARYCKNWNDLTELLKGDADAGTWEPAWEDNRSAEQTAGDAIDAGLPEEAAKEPNALELARFLLEEYVDLKPHEYITGALWVLHSHVFDRFMVSPRLAFTSPVNGCGKHGEAQFADGDLRQLHSVARATNPSPGKSPDHECLRSRRTCG
jgi:hypothetical protein